jgi:hypothetical protein
MSDTGSAPASSVPLKSPLVTSALTEIRTFWRFFVQDIRVDERPEIIKGPKTNRCD